MTGPQSSVHPLCFGMELTRVGGSGDEGIDGIGLAPLSPVLSSRVAVQAKRYEPSTTRSETSRWRASYTWPVRPQPSGAKDSFPDRRTKLGRRSHEFTKHTSQQHS